MTPRRADTIMVVLFCAACICLAAASWLVIQ